MNPGLYARYRKLQDYVGFTDDDANRIAGIAGLIEPFLPGIVDQFYAEVVRHAATREVITGGSAQIARLKESLSAWLRELFSGTYDAAYAERRWRVGFRHVEIGLDQVYTNAALSRIRRSLVEALKVCLADDVSRQLAVGRSLGLLIDLDLAIIEDAYQSEYTARIKRSERLARIAETYEVREALHQSETALRAVLAAAPCMIVILSADARIRYFSPFAEQLTGYRAEELLQKDYYSLFISESHVRSAIEREMRAVLAGIPTLGFENAIRCRDGSERWMVWNAQRLDDYQGEVVVLGVGQDITTLKQAQLQALQAERLAAIGQMMTGLAHESRNALQRSQACLEMLTLELQDRPVALDLVSRIQRAQDDLHQLYEEVRSYAAPIVLKRVEHDVLQILHKTWDHLAVARTNRNARLTVAEYKISPRCEVDSLALEQVFRNVLENALSAAEDPVEIVVELNENRLGNRPAITIAFGDNGPGLTAEARRMMFEPFYTTKTKGTGLGLAISRRLVEAHGGKIGIGPDRLPGATVVVTLPRT